MERDIKPERIANAIMMDERYEGYYVLVEGEQDIKIFRPFFDGNISRLKVMHGKYNMRSVYEILTGWGFERAIGIRDADFLRIPNNPKYSVTYNLPIFPTDYHDAEGMVTNSPAVMRFLGTITNDEKIKNFEGSYGDIVSLAYELSYPLACLRLANKRFGLGLSFKPKEKEGRKLKIWKFVCEKTIKYLGHECLINTVWEYSKNRGVEPASKPEISRCLDLIIGENHDVREMVNGHDIAEVLFILCKKGLKSQNKALVDADCVEDMMFLAYENTYFRKSNLFNLISAWENSTGCRLTL
ncbi:DUF4435 domain-containing protein [Rahnella perminowiae]|uniref:DUF4435 domain-containing protein n=1 Tax=Rahnella perminowiae TaxID=2816244 RepID=UPI001C268FE7|nr:DUF4435 domain-containing protein [Rahnella perminowiae]